MYSASMVDSNAHMIGQRRGIQFVSSETWQWTGPIDHLNSSCYLWCVRTTRSIAISFGSSRRIWLESETDATSLLEVHGKVLLCQRTNLPIPTWLVLAVMEEWSISY